MPVYAMRCGEFVKVGTTCGDVEVRLSQIQGMCPYPVTLVGVSREGIDTGHLSLESWHHRKLQKWLHHGEWFRLCVGTLTHLSSYFVEWRVTKVRNPYRATRRRAGVSVRVTSSRMAVKKRRELVISLLEAGVKPGEIARRLGTKNYIVSKDLKAARKEVRRRLTVEKACRAIGLVGPAQCPSTRCGAVTT